MIESSYPTEKFHDPIKYLPVEKQVFDLFKSKFENVSYSFIGRKTLILNLDGVKCYVEKNVKGVALKTNASSHPMSFDYRKYPSMKFDYNKNIDGKINKFVKIIKSIKDLESQAKALTDLDLNKNSIEEYLQQELSTERLNIQLCDIGLTNGSKLTFYVYPNEKPPATGILLAFDEDQKIVPYWSGVELTDVIYDSRSYPIRLTMDQMKEKIKLAEELKLRIDSFDPSGNIELVKLFNLKKQGNDLLKKFEILSD